MPVLKLSKRSYNLSIERRLILLCSAALAALPAMAQNAPILRPGVTEVGGFVGASYGIDQTRVMGGGNVVYSLTQTFMPFGEVSYFPGIGRSTGLQNIPGATATYSIPLVDFNAGFHLRIPIPKSRIIPYGVISAGGIHTPQRTINVVEPNLLQPGQTNTIPLQEAASTNFAISFGGGIRYYTTERFGFRVEFKAYKPIDAGTYSNNLFYRVAGGIFYQF